MTAVKRSGVRLRSDTAIIRYDSIWPSLRVRIPTLKNSAWLKDAPAYVQFWQDIPGQENPKGDVVAIGICRTRTIAERRAAEKLEQLGINSAQTFIESTCSITFRQRGKSGSSPSQTVNAIHSSRRRSIPGDTPWTSGFIPSSKAACLPTPATAP